MKIIKEEVKRLLKEYPTLRDSDSKLIATIWLKECMKCGITEQEARMVLNLFATNRLTSPESIMRSRRQAQEHNPELRGETYNERHNEVKNVKRQLGYNV